MSTLDPQDADRPRDPGDDRERINARFEQLVAPLRDEVREVPRRQPVRPESPRETVRPQGPFSLDAALAAAEPDDEPLELPPLPRPRMRPALVVGFALLGVAFVLAFLAMLGVRVGHDLGIVATCLGVIGLVVLLLNVRRGERDDSFDHDPRDGSRV